ncbi:Protein saf4 [Knufia peltigerae]|uniref:Protein saf4 n=1 Tax=Knufia peltigerae TaxID=1002370 RepID=A0AA38YBB9_9EURO|nr:Protein saf4 [Knufia peltigerae]
MQGFNMGRYVPPDLEGTTSFNQASGKGHALGHRARKLKTEGILTVRFECPFAIWCTTCVPEQIIGQGVRFNAEKKKVGAYYSTPIWQFRFKHTTCGGWLEVRTDPKNAEYIVTGGGRRRDTGGADDVDRFGQLQQSRVSEEDKARFEKEGAFGALEKKVEDKSAFVAQQERISELREASDRTWKDPYALNRKLRADFRVGRRKRQADERTGEALKDKFGLDSDMEVLAETQEDADRVKFVEFGDWTAAEASSSSKPLFMSTHSRYNGDLPSRPKHVQSGGVGGGTGPGKGGMLAKQKDKKQILQGQLANNTRMATDPFLRETEVWQPRGKRKREIRADGDDDREEDAVTSGEPEQKKVTKVTKGIAILALVGYESDSDV